MRVFEGRSNRATYWASLALLVLISAVVAISFKTPPHVGEFILIIIAVPRLHDIGKSAWFVLWPVGLEILSIAAALVTLSSAAILEAMGFVTLIIASLIIWLGCIPGQNFNNRFGEPPASGVWRRRSKAN